MEREGGEGERLGWGYNYVSTLFTYVYTYIHTYIWREREGREKE